MHGSDYKLRITQAVQEAFSEVKPKSSPSGAHAIFVVGQVVVNLSGNQTCHSTDNKESTCCGWCRTGI